MAVAALSTANEVGGGGPERLAEYLHSNIHGSLFTCLGSHRPTQIDVIFIDIFVYYTHSVQYILPSCKSSSQHIRNFKINCAFVCKK